MVSLLKFRFAEKPRPAKGGGKIPLRRYQHLHISPEFGFIYVSNPKVACSSTKASLNLEVAARQGIDHRIDSMEQIHSRQHNLLLMPKQMGRKKFEAMLQDPSVLRFSFVRDPVLLRMGFADENIFLNLELHMKCGLGKCGKCRIGNFAGTVFFSAPIARLGHGPAALGAYGLAQGLPADARGVRRALCRGHGDPRFRPALDAAAQPAVLRQLRLRLHRQAREFRHRFRRRQPPYLRNRDRDLRHAQDFPARDRRQPQGESAYAADFEMLEDIAARDLNRL